MNEILRRAILGANLDEVDVAARLEVDPKTVRRWLEGRLPYMRHRWALASLLNLNETDLWPELRHSPSRPDELLAVYPRRSSIPHEIWRSLFASAQYEIGVLDDSGLLLAEDDDIIRIFSEKAHDGVHIRIALSDPSSADIATTSVKEDGSTAISSKTQNPLTMYQRLGAFDHVEIRLHTITLYNSIYRADKELIIEQHAYAIPAARRPLLRLRHLSDDGIACSYVASFDEIWNTTRPA